MTTKREKRKQVIFTTSKGRGSFELRPDTDETIYLETKRLAKVYADHERYGAFISDRDKKCFDNLPPAIRDKFIKFGLAEGDKRKLTPTLGVFLGEYGASRPGKESMHERLTSYLVDYFGVHKRLNEITPAEAAGILSFWANDRKKKGKRGGTLSKTTITKALTWVKSAFKAAAEWGYLDRSPFAKVKGDNVETNRARHYTVTIEEFNVAIGCLDNVELKGYLAFARLAGLRPSDIKNLCFKDFETANNGRMFFRVPVTGKTGTRKVPLYDSLHPFYDALVAVKQEGQVYLFGQYHSCTNMNTLIKKRMIKAGLPVWEQFIVNCRRTCINEKREKGFSQQERTAVFGNTPMVREKNYDGELTADEIALLGAENVHLGVPAPADVPAVPVWSGNTIEPATFEKDDFLLGLPDKERYFPTLPGDSSSVWEMIDNGASSTEVIESALLRVGYPGKTAWRIAENDKYAFDFYMDVTYCRERICDYQKQRISYVELVGTVAAFCFKNLRRAWQGSIISKEVLNLESLGQMAGTGHIFEAGSGWGHINLCD